MSQRMLAGILAVPLILALWVAALWLPLPYVTYQPGLTVDVFGQEQDQEIIQVTGHKTFRDDGELRMTTVYVSQPGARINLFEVMKAWLSKDDAVYPYDVVYQPEETAADSELESAVQMTSSQDEATAVALRELGYDPKPVIKIQNVAKGTPADGGLKVGDVLVDVGGTPIVAAEDVGTAVRAATPGKPLTFKIERDGQPLDVSITPRNDDGVPRVGIVPGPGFTFPFDVHVNIDPNIGGPSAGLMFSLAIFDTLTPGSLTGDEIVAGTGTIQDDGSVGPIGGIQQKIVSARDAGAKLFLVPPDNCDDALGAPNEDMRLVRADTMHDAVTSIEAWVENPDASLPTCTPSADATAGASR